MTYDKALSLLKEKVVCTLPGERAHKLMLPQNRNLNINFKTRSDIRESAVAIVLYPEAGEIFSVLIERAIYNGIHSGQISLPGGKKENVDKNFIETALRETHEEIGIEKDKFEVLGSLSKLHIPHSLFIIRPIIVSLKSKPLFKPNPTEVNHIITYNIDLLLYQQPKTKIFQSAKYTIEAPYYDINGYSVWGATAMILSEFKALL